LNYQAKQVNDQAFVSSFSFVPNGYTVAFVLNNSNNNPTFNGASFSAGAGCEGGFYQAFSQPEPPNNVFALMLDQYDYIHGTDSSFTYSSAQIYQQSQSPCIPNDNQTGYYVTNKISTSPVPLNSPANSESTTTGHTYSATIVYTGTNLSFALYDETAGGTCSPVTSSTCFYHTWNGVQIPAMVDGTSAWVGITQGVPSLTPSDPLLIDSFSYTVLSAAATPTCTPGAGSYSTTQSVTCSDTSSNSVICYNTVGAPYTDGNGNCPNGTKYTGAISVSAGQTLYVVAGAGSSSYGDSPVASYAYQIGSTSSAPTFSISSADYNGEQYLILSAAQGTVICYNTTGSPATNGSGTGCQSGSTQYNSSSPITISSSETVYAVSGLSGQSDSAVNSATYTINPWAGQAPANSPTFSPLPGTYSGAQSVSISCSTPSSNICYVLSATTPAMMPQTDNRGGCTSGTPYSSAISVSSSQTLYAMCGTTASSLPSSLTQANYIIAP
jgi:hypothetical protein